jgi:hypothetical protein
MGYNHDKVLPGLIDDKDLCKIKEAVCIQVEKIYDSCKEKDCIEDARVFFRNPDRINWLYAMPSMSRQDAPKWSRFSRMLRRCPSRGASIR